MSSVGSAVSAVPKRLLSELRRYCKHARTRYDPDATVDLPIQITDTIWIYADPSKVTSLKALVLGPTDTPYENGFFLFDIQVPGDYPNVPPKVKILTTDGKVHFNPNMYKNGKVCLSILGTWSGPSWTCAMNVESLCVDIQSLLVADPLTNEPTYETRRPSRAYKYDTYNAMIEHATVRVAIWQMLHNTPLGCDAFVPVMQKLFAEYAPSILQRVEKLHTAHPDSKVLNCDMWFKFSETVHYAYWQTALRDLYAKLNCVIEKEQDEGGATQSVPDLTNEAPSSGDVIALSVGEETLQIVTPSSSAGTTASVTKSARIRRPTKADMTGKSPGDTTQVTQKDGSVVHFRLRAGVKDPTVVRWWKITVEDS